MSGPEALRGGVSREPRWLTRRTVVGLLIFLGVLVFFLTQTRLPAVLQKLPSLGNPASGRGRTTFGRFVDPEAFPPGLRWIAYGLNLWDANAIGMFFAILLGGAASAALAPEIRLRRLLGRRGAAGAGLGGGLGLPLFMCSACSAPVSVGFLRAGASLEATLGIVLGSSLFNPVGIFAVFLLMPVSMALARVGFGVAMLLLVVPVLARRERRPVRLDESLLPEVPERVPPGDDSWRSAARGALSAWWSHTADVALRLGPAMFAAGFLVGAVLVLAQPQGLSDAVRVSGLAVVATAAMGTLVQLPTLFEIPLVLGVLALGLGPGPGTALLLAAPGPGLVTFTLLRQDLGWETPALLLGANFALAAAAGLVVGSL